ncbi:hypothetical protein N7492_002551 [Penicillium capsulatum]|uniref:RNB domain-containing protein n=1 Tax=Penicillium capsulatum TaxID=69766 RepID=A0A9W9IPB0_9EURO|nr:hypothetical protein N7492_002551 [Penicillium capsulatum]
MLNGRDAWDSPWDNSPFTNRDELEMSSEFEGDHLEPGDLVGRLAADGLFSLAIYVQSVHKQKQFYTDRGNWRICSLREIDFVVKNFAPPELLDPIKPYFPNSRAYARGDLQSVPEGGLPRPLGAPLLTMMASFEENLLEFYRVNMSLLEDIHTIVADESDFLRLSIEELAMKVLGIEESQLNSINLFAVHKAVRHQPFLIEKDFSSIFRPTYLIQPARIAKVVHQVITWVHEHQEYCTRAVMAKDNPGIKDHPMHRFILKAQRLIARSRKLRSPTVVSCVGPSSQKFRPGQDDKPMVYRELLTETFNDKDQAILEFLQLYAIPTVLMPSGTLQTAASHIMRATGMYNYLGLSESSSRLFLQELGVIAPWENLALLDQTLLLPGHGMSLFNEMRWEEVEEACKETQDSLTDSMQHLRKDWGALPVYCVDDITAQEIDDGVSLERIEGSDDTFWVHIHVANPTAFLNHDGLIMEYAASRVATTYAPERTYPIFPSSFTQSHFSLAAGRPTITFSAKMNLQGDIIETNITNGTVNNVISITHGTLRKFLNPEWKPASKSLTVGGDILPESSKPGKNFRDVLSTEDQENFTVLRQLMLAFRSQRQKAGAMDMPNLRANTSLTVQMGTLPVKPYEMQVNEGHSMIGDPIICLQLQDDDPHEIRDQSKDYLISLLMNLAGHIAGQFCAARKIPVVYDGTWYDPEYGRVTHENIKDFGGQTFYGLVMPRSSSSSSPIHHHMLGLGAYVKSTSPLRRFTDVIAHYQIEAALRFENKHGRQLDAAIDMPESSTTEPQSTESDPDPASKPSTLSPLPFTVSDLDTHIISSHPIRARLRQVSSFSTQHWACLLLFRAFYFRECELPPTFPCLLRTPRNVPPREGTVFSGAIANLGVDCVVTIPDGCPDKDRMDVFGIVDARIIAVDMANLEVKMEAIGLIKPFERTGEWA